MRSKRFIACSIIAVAVMVFACRASWAEDQASQNQGKVPWLGPKADLNKDGVIDETEKKMAHEKWIEAKRKHRKIEADVNHDGVVDETEKKHAIEDKDNNPPGPKGGPGTNWENPPGPAGGPGVGPDGRPRFDRDNNPPGPVGGHGTNWENPPGPQGGPGASPDRKHKK